MPNIRYKQIAITFLSFCIFIFTIKYQSRFDIDNFNAQVSLKASQEMNKCKDDYYFSYISVNDSLIVKQLKFIDQIKIIKRASGSYEPISVKFRNKHWGRTFDVDKQTFSLIKKGVGNAIYFQDLSQLQSFTTINDVLNSSQEIPHEGGFIAVKSYTNIVYLFIIVNTNKNNKRILTELYNFTNQYK